MLGKKKRTRVEHVHCSHTKSEINTKWHDHVSSDFLRSVDHLNFFSQYNVVEILASMFRCEQSIEVTWQDGLQAATRIWTYETNRASEGYTPTAQKQCDAWRIGMQIYRSLAQDMGPVMPRRKEFCNDPTSSSIKMNIPSHRRLRCWVCIGRGCV
jgi:hypothetical protein